VFFDDFDYYITTDRWTSLTDGTDGTVIYWLANNGQVELEVDTSDNAEAGVVSTNELWLFTANKAMECEARIQYTETDAINGDANVAFGWADAMGANLLSDDGAGANINDSGALIYKIDGGTVWRFNTSIGGTAADSVSTKTAGGAAWAILRIEIIPISSTVFEARPFVDGAQLIDSTSGDPIRHTITLGTATNMDIGAYAKTGAAQAENVYIDYIYASNNR